MKLELERLPEVKKIEKFEVETKLSLSYAERSYEPITTTYLLVHFASHEQTITINKLPMGSWFKYCAPCEFRKKDLCFGGELYLREKPTYVASFSNRITSMNGFNNHYTCIRKRRREFSYDFKAILDKCRIKFPPYIIAVDFRTKQFFWYAVLDDNKVVPFHFSNVNIDGLINFREDTPSINNFADTWEMIMNLKFFRYGTNIPKELCLSEYAEEISERGAEALLPYLAEQEVEPKDPLYFLLNSRFLAAESDKIKQKILPLESQEIKYVVKH